MTMVYVSIFPSPCHPDVENIRGVDEVYTTVPTQRYERNDDKWHCLLSVRKFYE
jgi:hypothetical protein